jgi:hypothetical protein
LRKDSLSKSGAKMIRDRIFISYRRSDVPDAVGDLRRALATHFGEQAVFQDSEAIGPGELFPQRLRNELARAAFVLVVIGPAWNGPEGDSGGLLSNPRDWVRMELLTALEDKDTKIIPLLVDRRQMPSRERLPEPIQALADHNAITLRQESIQHDIGPVVALIAERISPIGGTGERASLRMAVREQLGSVVAAHVWALWQLLLPHRDEPQFSFNLPTGFRERDLRELQLTTQWLTDVAERDAGWWRDVSILVTADATVWVASDVMDRLTPPDDSKDTMANRRRTAIERLAEIAKQQNLVGDRTGASDTMNMAKCLQTLDVQPSYLVDLDSYRRLYDDVEIIGERPFGRVRAEVSWFVDCLRPDPMEVDRFGEPLGIDPPPASVYRWGRLLRSADDPATVWESRFSDNSWFRRVLQRARNEYPSGQLARLSKGKTQLFNAGPTAHQVIEPK